MRQKKTNPNHTKTRLYSEVERALKAGIKEVVLSLATEGTRRQKLVAMHLMGDRVLFFDPELNPELSYAADLGTPGTEMADGIRYEGNGLHSIARRHLQERFFSDEAYALIPRAFKLLAG